MNNNPLIDLETARALVARGWSVVPTESDAEKRPKGRFASAKSWRDFSDRLPTDAELLGWFGPGPRRGGVVLHRGQLCVDRDTKDEMPDVSAPWEDTDHGSHEFFQCAVDAQIAHDHDAKIDYLTYGSFVRLANTRCLLDWQGELPRWAGGAAQQVPCGGTSAAVPEKNAVPDTLLAALQAQGWREREAVLRRRGRVEPAEVRSDDRADIAGQVGSLLVQRALPRVRRAVRAGQVALTRRGRSHAARWGQRALPAQGT